MPAGAAIIAIGGYGRAELCPASDLDILLCFAAKPAPAAEEWAGAFTRSLWDSGRHASVSTRTVKECAEDAGNDIEFLTSLCSARTIAGDDFLPPLAGIVSRADKRAAGSLSDLAAVREALASQSPALYGKSLDLKEAPGGLRHLHRMEWASALAGKGRDGWKAGLGRRRVARILCAYDRQLWVRIALHTFKGRAVEQLGQEDARAISGEEYPAAFLGSLYNCRRELALAELRFLETYAEGAEKKRGFFSAVFGKRGGAETAPGGAALSRPGATVASGNGAGGPAAEGAVPAGEGDQALAAILPFLPVARGESCLSARLVDEAACAAATLPRSPLGSRAAFNAFREVLGAGRAGDALAAMDLAGLLHRLVPPFGPVRFLPSREGFHDLPVGPHSLKAVAKADIALDPVLGPLASRAISGVAARYRESAWIPKLAVLLHDCGKALPGDHSKNGAALARAFLGTLPTEPLIKAMVAELVEDHLLLGAAARSVNPAAPAELGELESGLSRRPFPEDSAGMLSLLSFADASATREGAWSGFRASRLEALARALDAELGGGGRGLGALEEARLRALAERDPAMRLAAFASGLGRPYLLGTPPHKVAEDLARAERAAGGEVFLEVAPAIDHLKVKVIARDAIGLFAQIAGILLVAGADIVRADIHTRDGVAIDEFVVTEVHGNDLLASAMEKELALWVSELDAALRSSLGRPGRLHEQVTRLKASSRPAPAALAAEARVRARAEGGAYAVDISCTDRPALLYDIAHFLSMSGLDIVSASIDTRGWLAEDSISFRSARELGREALDHVEAELAAICGPA